MLFSPSELLIPGPMSVEVSYSAPMVLSFYLSHLIPSSSLSEMYSETNWFIGTDGAL